MLVQPELRDRTPLKDYAAKCVDVWMNPNSLRSAWSRQQWETAVFGLKLRACFLVGTLPPPYARNLVDSASSHTLVSKIKPCMSKYKQLYRETANGSLNQLSFI